MHMSYRRCASRSPQLRAHAHAPGSNVGTHRGPDLKPRLFLPSQLIKAFTDKGELAQPEPYKQRSGAEKRTSVPTLAAVRAPHKVAPLGVGPTVHAAVDPRVVSDRRE
jgi:hypothetical protein